MDDSFFQEVCSPGATCRESHLALSHGVTLRLFSFKPPSEPDPRPVVMLPGLVSVMLSFKNLLRELTSAFVIYYVESREKISSKLPDNAAFDIQSMGYDLKEVVRLLKLKDRQYILFGASLSATVIIDSCPLLVPRPFCLILLEPNAVFDYPGWGLILIRVSDRINYFVSRLLQSPRIYKSEKSLLKYLAKWYIKHFRVNKKEDYEMYRISSRALDSASPYKLRKTVLSISSYHIWDHLEFVNTSSLLVCASKDRFHRHEDILKMVSGLYQCTYLDLEVHKRTNSAELGRHIREYVRELSDLAVTEEG